MAATAPQRSTQLAPTNKPASPPQPVHDSSQFANLLDSDRFEHMWRVASMFSQSALIPDHFRGKPADCFVGLQMAVRLGIDPFMFLQSCYVVHGKPGIEAKMAIALANNSGKLHGPITYEMSGEGDTRACKASAVMKETGEKVSMTVDMKTVKAEGWLKNDKWKNMPDVMFRYRSAMWLIRTHFPEVILGMQSAEELEDVNTIDGPQPQPLRLKPSTLDELTGHLEGTTGNEQQQRQGAKADTAAEETGPAAASHEEAGEGAGDHSETPPEGAGSRPPAGWVERTRLFITDSEDFAACRRAYDEACGPQGRYQLTEDEYASVTEAWQARSQVEQKRAAGKPKGGQGRML